jgi:hypothetical protein
VPSASVAEAGVVETPAPGVVRASEFVVPLSENPSIARAYAWPAVEKNIELVSSPT